MPKLNHSVRYEAEDSDEALEAYLPEQAIGLGEHSTAQHRAFIQIEGDAYVRYPDPIPLTWERERTLAVAFMKADGR